MLVKDKQFFVFFKMKAQQIRLKNNFLLIEEEQEFFFVGSYGKGVVIRKADITNQLLKQLTGHLTRQELLQKLAVEFSIPASLVEKLVARLTRAGVLERFTATAVSSDIYRRYETQLSFFDLLQPVTSVAQKLKWQQLLNQFHIVVIGMGGIGNYAALSFAAMGVGEITLIDNDSIDSSNLNRQILFTEKDMGRKKTEVAAAALQKLNSHGRFNIMSQHICGQADIEKIFWKIRKPHLVFISADTAELPVWMNALPNELACPFIKASYQGSTGFIGPLIEPEGKLFTDIVVMEQNNESALVREINALHKHASCSPVNAVIANMAVLESVKYLLQLPGLQVKERRLFFDFISMRIEAE